MANELNLPNLFNPMSFWTDAGLNALDAAVSSTQNIGDGVDRAGLKLGFMAQP